MVFPSLPIYLDPPNWSQQQANQQAGIGTQNPTATVEGGGGYQGSIRPGSMADRARLAKIHQPDAAQKCPRCESTNTKFCYYNNYSLSQPRHFCKTCRRYWTRGGALRNVPVGGGCRRNKRSKGNAASSKSPLKPANQHRQAAAAAAGGGSSSASANSSSNNNGCTSDVNVVMAHLPTPAPTQLPFFASLHHYNNNDYVSGGIGSHFGATPTTHLVAKSTSAEFQIGAASSVGNNGGSLLLSNGLGTEQWRLPNWQQLHQQQHQQFPFLTNLEPQIGLFQFGSGENNNAEPPRFIRSKAMDSSSVSAEIMPQLNTIKMEENHQGFSLPKNLLSGSGNNDLFWNGSGNAWSSEVPSFTPSPSHLL